MCRCVLLFSILCPPPLIRHYHLLTTYLYKGALMVRGCAGFTPKLTPEIRVVRGGVVFGSNS